MSNEKSKLGLTGKLKPSPSVDEFHELRNKLEDVANRLARIEERCQITAIVKLKRKYCSEEI